MNQPFPHPHSTPHSTLLILSWEDVEAALTVLAMPHRLKDVEDTMEACKALPATSGISRTITILSAIAWLTADPDDTAEMRRPRRQRPTGAGDDG